jgi:drug/metabolite transporter (DMT)-like permease
MNFTLRSRQSLRDLSHQSPSTHIILLLLLLTVIRGGNFVGMKVSLKGLTPLLAAGLRNLIGSFALVGYAAAMRRELMRYSRIQISVMILLGGLLALNFALVYAGLTHTTASRAAILLNAQPLLVAFSRLVFY